MDEPVFPVLLAILPRPTATVVLAATLQLLGIQQRSQERVAALVKLPGVTTNVVAPYGTPHDHRVVPVRELVVRQVLVAKVVSVTKMAVVRVFPHRQAAVVFPAASREQTSVAVVAVAAIALLAVLVVRVAEQVVLQAQLVAQVRPTPVAVAVAVLPDVHLVALAVRALSLCVTQTCPPFRVNPLRARCRLEYQPLLQLLLQQRAQRFRTSGKKMVLIFRVQHRRATPLPHQL